MNFLLPVPGPARLTRRHVLTSWLTLWLALLLLLVGSGPLLAAQPSASSPTSSLPATGSATPGLAPANSADDVLNQLGLAPATPQFLPAERAFILSSQQQGKQCYLSHRAIIRSITTGLNSPEGCNCESGRHGLFSVHVPR